MRQLAVVAVRRTKDLPRPCLVNCIAVRLCVQFSAIAWAIGGENMVALSSNWAFAGRSWKPNRDNKHPHESR